MTHLEVISLFKAKRVAQNQYEAICPAHEDKNPSLGINTGERGKTLIHCRAGCSTEAVCAAVGIEMKDLFDEEAPKRGTPAPAPKKTATPQKETAYNYSDFTGRVQLRKVRRYDADGKKHFTWQHQGENGWESGRAKMTPGLYNQEGISGTESLFIVEGEKDVETLKTHGIVAVSGADGAGPGKWRPEHTPMLHSKHIAIIPDNDDVGRAFAQETAAALHGVAASVRVLDLTKMWPDLPEHGDVTDLYEAMGDETEEILRAHVISTPIWDPSQEVGAQASSNALEIISARDLMGMEFDELMQPVEQLICEGLTFLVGASKIGKSWLILLMAACVARGEPFLGRKTTKSRVLYLALEDSQRRLKYRLKEMKIAPVPDNLELSTAAAQIGEGLQEQLEAWLSKEPGPALVIIDTFQKARGTGARGVNAYQDDYKIVGHLKAIADKYRAAVVCIHHTNKAKFVDDPYEKISGSTGIMGSADTTILMCRERDSAEATVKFTGRDVWGDDFVIRLEQCRWELVSNNAAEYQAKNDYEKEPLVILFRKLITENPKGGRWTYTNLQAQGLEFLGYQPFIDGKDCATKLNDGLATELRKRDGILVECGIRVASARGIKLQQVSKIIAFPTKMQTDDE